MKGLAKIESPYKVYFTYFSDYFHTYKYLCTVVYLHGVGRSRKYWRNFDLYVPYVWNKIQIKENVLQYVQV